MRSDARSTMDRMKAPDPRIVLMAVALVGVGSFAGAFLDRLSFPRMSRMLNVCASSKQFIVEFRIDEPHYYGERIPALLGEPLNVARLAIEVDGVSIGDMERYGSIRHFVCEGNHRARVRYPSDIRGETEEHEIEFAVSRPSLFHITGRNVYSNEVSTTCVPEARCRENVALELSPWEPDALKVRMFPLETKR
jgi:hypothetical protein